MVDELQLRVEKTQVFAELTPRQKARLVTALKENGHTVGFVGDGFNDLSALLAASVAISVDTAAEEAKDISDVDRLSACYITIADSQDPANISCGKVFANVRMNLL